MGSKRMWNVCEFSFLRDKIHTYVVDEAGREIIAFWCDRECFSAGGHKNVKEKGFPMRTEGERL